jgi:RHS repeat-associated protein
LNEPTRKTDALGGVTSFSYDGNGNLLSVTDPQNTSHPTTYTYDNMDRLQTRTDPLENVEIFGYDGKGNLTCFTDRRGKVSVFGYDGLNRVVSAGFGASSCAGTSFESATNYTYDAGNRLASVVDSVSGTITPVFDSLNRLISETTPQGSVSYQYDVAGRETAMAVAGQAPVSYTYDNANRLTQIQQGNSAVGFTYDADSRRTSLTLPNGVVTTYGYDGDSRLTSLSYQNGTTLLGDLTYAYDQAGRVTQVGGSYARTGLPAAVSSATYNAANRLVSWGANSSFTYDANGNLTGDGVNTYVWDARNQLASIFGGTMAGFQYDPLGRRISKTVDGITTDFLYDGANVAQELSGGIPSANLLTGRLDQVFARTDTSMRNFLSDRLGSAVALTDSSGAVATQYTYEPFGNTSSSGSSSSNSFQYTSRENDGTGVYFYRGRYYNPTFQRFISEDPIGLAGSGPNLYAYVGNNPISFRDPFGTDKRGAGWASAMGHYLWNNLTNGCGSSLQNICESTIPGPGGFAEGFASETGTGIGTVVRYASAGEAEAAAETGFIPNTDQFGNPKSIFVTPEGPLSSASDAESAYQIGSQNPLGPSPTPTHVIIGDANGITFDYGGNVEGGTGIELTTTQPIPVISVTPIGK